ncbi:DUF6172 family protein [Cellvibrio polysaccharolyticus]|uniref:Uncharacterized protein n=1 Tax=Cellvibrio polysaccharolyticus TaxID=2082724 RepID=A0A928V0G1_9GAMM|nr:DUF6172 family protein [Cellvibrio polysaccharolyticus]MBE8716453.1 hypothetical protein [Cellvibrio polysaccharolyticus]
MKKTFKLHIEGKNPDRVLEAIKHEVRKYVKRERNKALPQGVDYWTFDCKFGLTEADAEVVALSDITRRMDAVAAAGGDVFYVEILAAYGFRKPREDFGSEADNELIED